MGASAASYARRLATVSTVILAVSYPFATYLAARRPDLRGVVFGIGAAIVVLILSGASSHGRWSAAFPMVAVALGATAWLLDRTEPLLAFPVVVNAALLVAFAVSLAGDMPVVERFARLVRSELSPDRVRYCRTVTLAWCVFFACNGAVAAGLAVLAPVSWWALYTGVLSYVLMAAMFAGEYAIRLRKFESDAGGLRSRVSNVLDRARSRDR